MCLPAPLGAADRAASRWRDALIDPARRERAVLISLVLYVLVWTAYGTIAKSSQGLHPDMTEIVAWSRDLSLGYLKHPPFVAWIAWLWFTLFPLAEWSYYLLAMLMPAIALWIFWKLSAEYLDVEKRVVGLALLTFVPFFNFHALKFNVNTVLLPLWAATTWFFLRSFRMRSASWAAAAGAMAAVCMLGKYWSIFLLAGLALATLLDKRRIAYLRSTAPWITIATGLLVVAPHLAWLVQNEFAPFSYATAIHGVKPFATTLVSIIGYLAGAFGYVMVPVIVALAMARPRPAALADIAWPRDTERRLAAAAFWAPLLLPALGAITGRTAITSLWSMPAFTLLPLLLLSSPAVTVLAIDTRRVLLGAAVLPMVMLIVSPAIAVMAQRASPLPASAHARLLAIEVERLWHQITPQPLRFVGGEADLAYGVATFASDRPRALTGLPQPSAAELARNGSVLVCFGENGSCRREADSRGAGAKVISTEIVRNLFGLAGTPQRYTIVIVPPQ